MASYSPTMTVMMKTMQKAVRRLSRDFGEVGHLQSSPRGGGQFTAVARDKVQEVLCEGLMHAKPDYGIWLPGQPYHAGTDTERYWVINPMEGLTNFAHGMPYFAISVALVQEKEGNCEVIASLLDAPVLKETFWSEKGKGAYLEVHNAHAQQAGRLRVAARKKLDQSLILCDEPTTAVKFDSISEGARLLGISSLALAYVAMGRFDGYVSASGSFQEHAAGLLLVQEAGGSVTDQRGDTPVRSEGEDEAGVVAANLQLQKVLLDS